MSIYGTWLMFDEGHEEDCGKWVESSPDCFELDDQRPCTCGRPFMPIIYEGSHHLPSDDDPRGGWVEVGAIPGFIEREGREQTGLWDWLRLGVGNEPSRTQYEGRPYVSGGDATVVLTRPQVERLRDTLTMWLERKPDADE